MPAETIDQVIQQLDDIIDWSLELNSRLGYFAALYRKVTLKVKGGISDGFFDDGQRMERLIRHPGFILGLTNKIIRLGERGSVPEIIGILR